ncbi:MAG TPA: T9SS type A sorting domain-containing protein, partial [Bacteroidia bacterium]|nr:T9SS type A sorting domain-containing protein [Bacteroidia bacterium]
IFMCHQSQTRQYSSAIKANKEDADAAGMAKYFFTARRNAATDSMDYKSMLAVDQAIKKGNATKKMMSNLGLTWSNMGPNNIGGRTRAILVDNRDNSGNTLFAGGVSGGLWKSTNAGQTWTYINDTASNICVSCIAQDINGNIYYGTGEGFSLYYQGEGFSTGILGGGIFKSTDDGATFSLLASTKPTISNNDGVAWAYVNRIAIQSNNPSVVYAGTNTGLFVSTDGGNTWTKAISGDCLDVKISADASVVVISLNGIGYYAYPTSSGTTSFTKMKSSGAGLLPNSYRIEFAISPEDHERVYASVVNSTGALIGEYMTKSAVSSGYGGYWYCIAPGGSTAFNPYGVGGGNQGDYDNTVGVDPKNEARALFGGTTLWAWQGTSLSDTLGGWTSLTSYYGWPYSPTSIHPDEHAIVFDPNSPNVVYVGCDGGIFKSVNNGIDWAPMNRNYDVTQYYAIAFGPYPLPNDIAGAGGGTQDNGSPYIPGPSSTDLNIGDAVDLSGGDGGQGVISYINPNAYFVSFDNNSLSRSANLIGLGSPGNAYDSILNTFEGSGCFVDPIALWESSYDLNTADSIWFYGDSLYKPGDTIYPHTPNGGLTYPYIMTVANTKDTFKVQNRVQSRIATGFNGTNGIWLNMRAIDFSDAIIWMPIGSPLNGFSATEGPVHCMAWSPDGDALFVGTQSGGVYRFSNLNAITDTSNGAVFSIHGGKQRPNPNCVVKEAKLGNMSNRDVLSISVDQNNPNNVIVTLGSYGYANNVYLITNALAATPNPAVPIQGTGMPAMPVYGSVFGIVNKNQSGNSYPNGAILATEHGVYSTPDATAASPAWTVDNAGMANTIVCAIGQQTAPQWMCSNSGKIYIGTHGRGIWVADDFFVAPTAAEQVANTQMPDLKVYPNPMSVQGTIEYSLTKADKISLDIYDIQGKLVKSIPVESGPGSHSVTFKVSDMPAGTYIASLTGNDLHRSVRFIVER